METNPNIWTDAFLNSMRQETDPLGDRVIADILDSGERTMVNLIFTTLRTNADLERSTLPAVLADYFEQAAVLPAWADQRKLDAGAKFFGIYGLEISMLLFFKSLPSAYTCPNGASVLHATGRLEEFQGSTEKFQRRIMETAQFVFNVSSPGAFKPNGRGIASAMKVRLMHAATRYFIERDGKWDAKTLGKPINQEDMAGTMLSFCSLVTEGLQTMGLKLEPELVEGYFHIWQVTGHLMGLRPEMIPAKEADGHVLGWRILDRNMGKSQQGIDLTKALTDFAADAIPGHLFDYLGSVFIRHYCGDQIADNLGLKRYGWFRRVLMPMVIDWFIRDLQKVEHFGPGTSIIARKLTRHFLQHTISKYYGYRQVEFFIPPSLMGNVRLTVPLTGHRNA